MRLGQYEEAAEWAIKAAARPNAHQHIMTVTAIALGLAGRHGEVAAYKARILEKVPNYTLADFLGAFRLSPDVKTLFTEGAKRIGIK